MPEEIRAIQCRSCGGAMYSDQKAAAYVCAFCGTSVPWTDEQVFWTSPITFRHKPVQIVDGAMKLGHVEVMTEVDPHDEWVLSQKYRQNSVAGKLALWDAAFAGVCRLTFVCPFCGGEFTGESTQHFFTCSYCSNTFEGEELVRPGGYRREFIMGLRSLPFVQQPLFSFPSPLDVLSKKQAHRAQPIPFTAPHSLMKNFKMKPCRLFLL